MVARIRKIKSISDISIGQVCCVSLYEIFNKRKINPEADAVYLTHEYRIDKENDYYDLYDGRSSCFRYGGKICCDGEECKVQAKGTFGVRFYNPESDTEFVLSWDEVMDGCYC